VIIVEEAPASNQEGPKKVAAVPAGHKGTRRATAVDARVAALTQELRDNQEHLDATKENWGPRTKSSSLPTRRCSP